MEDDDIYFGDGKPTDKGEMLIDLFRMGFQNGKGLFALAKENDTPVEELMMLTLMKVLHEPPTGFEFSE